MTKCRSFSIVRREEGQFHVRARLKGDLENLIREVPIPGAEVSSRTGPDYPHRLILPKEDVIRIFTFLGEGLDFANFKGMVGMTPVQANRVDAYHEIWQGMARESGAYGREGKQASR